MRVETPKILDVLGLTVETTAGAKIVENMSFSVAPGEVLAIVGESGCGKTSTALGLLGYGRAGTQVASGSVLVDGIDILTLSPSALREARGGLISYVPQDPTASLNPRHRIGRQVAEPLILHGFDRSHIPDQIRDLLARVQLPNNDSFLRRYPFELSGGQQQRLAIAMALISQPRVVVLDEPTTGLDVTTQKQVLQLLIDLTKEAQAAFVYVTHDLAVVNELADRVVVMYAGSTVESGPTADLFRGPHHPYTAMLLSSVPRLSLAQHLVGIPGTAHGPTEKPDGCVFASRCPLAIPRCIDEPPPAVIVDQEHEARCWRTDDVSIPAVKERRNLKPPGSEALLAVSNLYASYGRGARRQTVLHDLSFEIGAGECFAVVGESGSGKSTLGRSIAGLHPHQGEITFDGTLIAPSVENRTQDQRRWVQLIYQNPARSLNPRETVLKAIWRSLHVFEGLELKAAEARVDELLERVRLPSRLRNRYPEELSGGERQRVAIARALAARPRLLVCDEITSALDVSIQAAITELVDELRLDGLALLFITHNLGLVRSVATRALVLEEGHVREIGVTEDVIDRPSHPYTRALIEAVPAVPGDDRHLARDSGTAV